MTVQPGFWIILVRYKVLYCKKILFRGRGRDEFRYADKRASPARHNYIRSNSDLRLWNQIHWEHTDNTPSYACSMSYPRSWRTLVQSRRATLEAVRQAGPVLPHHWISYDRDHRVF
jgi:hypothetical protein